MRRNKPLRRILFLFLLTFLSVWPATIQAGEGPQTPITLDEPVTTELDDEFAFYELTLDEPNILSYSLTSRDFDPLLSVIFVDTGETVVSVDDSQGTLDAHASDIFAQSGVYQIVVSSSDGTGRGEYTLTVSSAIAGTIAIGDTVSGEIKSEADRYLISVEAGDQFLISLTGDAGSDVSLDLLEGLEFGTPYIFESDYDSGQRYDALLGPYQAVQDQSLLIAAYGYVFGESSGEYTLSVERVSAESVACGDEIEGTLEAGSPGNYYALDLNHGDELRIYVESAGPLDPELVAYSPENRIFAIDDDSGLGRDAEISDMWVWTAGTHMIGVRAFELASAGDYTMTIECRHPVMLSEEPITVLAEVKIGRNTFTLGNVDAGFTFDFVVEGLEVYTASVYIDNIWDGSLDGEYTTNAGGLLTIELYTQLEQDLEYQVSIIER